MSRPSFRIGAYNLLAPYYAEKYKQKEGILENGTENWSVRWPALAQVLSGCPWDILCLVELAKAKYSTAKKNVEDLCLTFAAPLSMCYFEHPLRKDALAILYAGERFDLLRRDTLEFNGAATALVDLKERHTGFTLRVMAVHQWHPMDKRHTGHMNAILNFAQGHVDCTVLAGDFNEDARKSENAAQQDLVRSFKSVDRQAYPHLPKESTPNLGQDKLDWIWVKGADPEYDDFCQHVIAASHRPCLETGNWPSDHGMEAVHCTNVKQRCFLGYVLPHHEGEAVFFERDGGAPGGVGAFILKRLAMQMPGETFRRIPEKLQHALLVPPTCFANLSESLKVQFPKPPPGGPWRCHWTGFAVGGSVGRANVVLTYEVRDPGHWSSMQGYIQGFRDACGEGSSDNFRLYVAIIHTSACHKTLQAALDQLGDLHLPRDNKDGFSGFEISSLQLLQRQGDAYVQV